MKQQIQKQKEQNISIRAALTGLGTTLLHPHGPDGPEECENRTSGEFKPGPRINSFVSKVPDTLSLKNHGDDEYMYSMYSEASDSDEGPYVIPRHSPVMRINSIGPAMVSASPARPPPAFRGSTVTQDPDIAKLIRHLTPGIFRRIRTFLQDCPYVLLNEALNVENESHRKTIRQLKLKTTLNGVPNTRKLEPSTRRAINALIEKCDKAENEWAGPEEEDEEAPAESFFGEFYQNITPFAERSTREKGMLVVGAVLGVMLVGHFYSRITSPRRGHALRAVDPYGPYATYDTDPLMSDDHSVETVPDPRYL